MKTIETKMIEKIGVEMEGGWEKKPLDLHEDISIKEVSGNYVGEISSPPMSLPEIEKWIRKNYPSFCNETCGFHVHISLRNNLDYTRLMTQDFYEYFLTEIEKWGKEKKSVRLTHINYCYGLHKTIEFRLFPMWKDTEMAISSVRKVIEIVETYLDKQPEEEKQFEIVVTKEDFDGAVFKEMLEIDSEVFITKEVVVCV